MNTDPRRFAPLGLILSGLGLLTVLGILVVRAFAAFGLYTPPDAELLNRVLIIAAGIFVLGFAVYALLDPERVRKLLTGRQARYGSNSFILFIAFIGILVVVNILAQQYPQRWDVTEDKQHTLAPETIQALQSLPEPVFATAFYSTRLNAESAAQLLEDFKANSNSNFDYQFMDPDSNPVLVNQLGITGDGKILLQMGEQQEIVTFAAEGELAGGLIRLLNPDKPVLYFLAGNGERDIETAGNTSYTSARQTLESKNYIVKTLNLQIEEAVPEDARALVIAGPRVPLTENSVSLIQDYIENGGSLLVQSDPVLVTEFGDDPDPLADYLAKNWGITLNNDIIVDPLASGSPFLAVAYEFFQHPITEKLQGREISILFPESRSITLEENSLAKNVTPLIATNQGAWGETDFESIQEQSISFDEGADLPGPLNLVVVAEDSNTGSRLVVFGSSSFAQDEIFNYRDNGDFLINTIDWAVNQETLINLSSNTAQERTFNPPGSFQFILTIVSAVCLIPLVIIAAGVYAWVMRRRRG
jgi:ABC-type uncharacterized transport system involved in gliding motility auxiliary subunit